jgi:hypothetical protein
MVNWRWHQGPVIAALLLMLTSSTTNAQRPDSAAWLADFSQLRDEMSAHYSTLAWQVRTRRMDLVRLVSETRDSILAARDDSGARLALRRFVAAFADGHLSISWPEVRQAPSATRPKSVCERLGFQDETAYPGVDFASLPSFTKLGSPEDRYFPGGVLRHGSRRLGVIRLALFEPTPFPELCDAAVRLARVETDGSCDPGCENQIDALTGDMLTEALVKQVTRLQAIGIDALVVDVTANPGGNDWNEPAARVLTARPIEGSKYGFIRQPHWEATIRRRIQTLTWDTAGLSERERARIVDAQAKLREALVAATTPCDQRPLWDNKPIGCSLVVDRPFFVTGLLPYAAPGSLPRRPSSTVLFAPSRYRYEEGAYRGPLLIVVDGGTASSAERFTAMLRDNDAALVVGTPTHGAGCGYTNGGIGVRLRKTGAVVKMPDCFQFRRDITSVGDGVTPDVLVPWRTRDTPYQRAERLVKALDELLPNLK